MSGAKVLRHDASFSTDRIVDFLSDTGAAFENVGGDRAGHPQQLVEGRLSDHRLVLKEYRTARQGWERFRPLRLTRAWRSYEAGNRLKAAGIATPKPRFLASRGSSLILACDQLEAQQLYARIRDDEWMKGNAQNLVAGLSELLDQLEAARITHGDFHPRNLLVDAEGKIWLVDLDGVQFHRSDRSFIRRRRKEENRLATQLEIRSEILHPLGFRRVSNQWQRRRQE